MPNWCSNFLTVTGPVRVLRRFKKENELNIGPSFTLGCDYPAIHNPLSFNKGVPLPAEEGANWYDWCVANWGTKWDIGDECSFEEIKSNCYTYEFSTAWSPPVEWLTKVCALYPKLAFHLHYEEPGNAFIGDTHASRGQCIDEHRDMTKEDFEERYGEED